MSTSQADIPGEDAWVIAHLGAIISHRLIHSSDDSQKRQSLLRFLFAVQRLPLLAPDLCVSLGSNLVHVAINSELFELTSMTDDGHTAFRLQYFHGSNHCLQWNDFLSGDEKRQAIKWRLDQLEEAMKAGEDLSIEDYSKAGYVDEPPLNDYLEYSLSYEES